MAERKRRARRVPPGDYECHQCGLWVQSHGWPKGWEPILTTEVGVHYGACPDCRGAEHAEA